MRAPLLDRLRCPACHGRLSPETEGDGPLGDTALWCRRCSTVVPVVQGSAMFAEGELCGDGQDAASVVARARARVRDRQTYTRFLQTKAERGLHDAYAMFQPFNESLRALLAVITPIREALRPGDAILDTWGRTGWTGAWIASLFPEHHVVSLWEGDTDVLGYSGYAYWLGIAERPANWDVVFTHPDRRLPFADGAFAFVHAYESLHRYRQTSLLAECRRVSRQDGAIAFTHVHLSNGEPDPFFERGCVQHHGTRYRAVLDRVLEGGERTGFVLGEPTLFERTESFMLTDAPDTADYNAAVLVGPRSWAGREITPQPTAPVTDASRLIVNPLLRLDLATGRVGLPSASDDDPIGHILSRHPCYDRRLQSRAVASLSDQQPELVYYAAHAMTFAEIAARLDTDPAALRPQAEALVRAEVLLPAEVSRASARLQDHYRTLDAREADEASFAALWDSLPERYGDRPLIETEDGTAFTYEIVDQLVPAVVAWLRADTTLGDRVLLFAPTCPEAYVVLWACWRCGRVAVPVEPDLPLDAVEAIIARARPRLAFASRSLSIPTVAFDSLA
ncbi:MAG: AMP-binding protein, partial [Myxococcota bacterium]